MARRLLWSTNGYWHMAMPCVRSILNIGEIVQLFALYLRLIDRNYKIENDYDTLNNPTD